MKQTKIYSTIFLALIILVATFLRLFQLGNFPFGITNDNASYIYSAYSVWQTGKGIDGAFLPLSFNTDSSNSPVPIYIDAPFVGLMGVSPLSGRLPYALAGIGSVFIIYGISLILFKRKSIALLSAFVLAISPWSVFISRTSYEANFAFFFYLVAIFIFLKNKDKGNVLWSLPFFLLGFYSYHATKIFFILLIPLLVILYRKELMQRRKELGLFALSALFIFLSFFIVLKIQHVTRQDILLPNDADAARIVNEEREKNTAPFFLREVFNNKTLYKLRVIRENYLEALSPQFLFLYGDTNTSGATLGMFSRGEMYIIEFPLLFFGLYFLTKQNKKALVFLIGLFLLGPLGSTFTEDKSFPLRDIMLLLPLCILAGLGIFQLFSWIIKQKKIISIGLAGIFSICYLFLVTSFIYQYFYRYPIYGGENWLHSTRTVLEFAGSQTKNYKNIYIVDNEKMFAVQYAIFNNINAQQVQKAWQQKIPKIGNVTFLDECINHGLGDPYTLIPEKTLYVTPGNCYTSSANNGTINDVGEPIRVLWRIYEN